MNPPDAMPGTAEQRASITTIPRGTSGTSALYDTLDARSHIEPHQT